MGVINSMLYFSLILIKIFADGSLFLLLFIFVHLAAFFNNDMHSIHSRVSERN
jgi:hypothetical protein